MFVRIKTELKATKADLWYELTDGVVMPEVKPIRRDPESAAARAKYELAALAFRPIVTKPAAPPEKRPPYVPRDRRVAVERRAAR